MYLTRPNLIIGFHGCDEAVRDKIVSGTDDMRKSTNDYDWLGNGAYFWEYNEVRALQYARNLQKNPGRCKSTIDKPAVLGAVIQLGYCLDLLDSYYLDLLRIAYRNFQVFRESFGILLPENQPINADGDLLIRKLDCAVIESLHTFNFERGKAPFDSVRGVFFEGADLYPNAGFKEKNHIQICIRNPNCIKGFFIPRKRDNTYNPV